MKSKINMMMMASALTLALCLGAWAQDGLSLLREMQNGFVQLHDRLRPSVVNIDVEGKAETMDMTPFGPMEDFFRFFNLPEQPEQRKPRQMRPQGTGSGFIYDASGLIITNNHGGRSRAHRCPALQWKRI